jgi:hypothetical protein
MKTAHGVLVESRKLAKTSGNRQGEPVAKLLRCIDRFGGARQDRNILFLQVVQSDLLERIQYAAVVVVSCYGPIQNLISSQLSSVCTTIAIRSPICGDKVKSAALPRKINQPCLAPG